MMGEFLVLLITCFIVGGKVSYKCLVVYYWLIKLFTCKNYIEYFLFKHPLFHFHKFPSRKTSLTMPLLLNVPG